MRSTPLKQQVQESQTSRWTRREFIKSAVAAIVALPFRAWPRDDEFFARTKTAAPQKLVVIGAGLAGLTAAYELFKAGHEVTVLEARNRAGGRVFTEREAFADGLHAECGAEWIEHNHEYLHRYIEEFGLSLYRGSFFDHEQEALRYSPRERTTHERLQEIVKQVDSFEHQQPSLPEYDRLSFREFLQQLDAPPEMIDEMQRYVSGLMAINIESISALHILNEFALPESRASFRIAGGNDQLPRALAQRLREHILYSRPVVEIAQRDDGVQVTFLENGFQQQLQCNRVVLTTPFTCVRKIAISPALPEDKQRAIQTLAYGQILKAPMQFRTRFWAESTAPRKSLTGLIGSVYEASGGQPGPRGILTAYIPDKSGMAMGALPPAERLPRILTKTAEIHPQAMQQFEGGFVKWWQEDEWAGGTYAYFRPGEITTVRPIIARPEGRIHFAGEHTAHWQGYMNGAVESGHRVAKEIHESRV